MTKYIKMTDKLPPNLLALFAPRPALRYLHPSDHAPELRQTSDISGVASFLPALEEYKDKDNYMQTESWMQRRDRIKQEKREKIHKLLNEGVNECVYRRRPLRFLLLTMSLQTTRQTIHRSAATPTRPSSSPA
ncbi:MAG: hypothetical protein INR71_08195 [Terriglobus roseus]|nr:hypothetical protein [Terriglobus roseus]